MGHVRISSKQFLTRYCRISSLFASLVFLAMVGCLFLVSSSKSFRIRYIFSSNNTRLFTNQNGSLELKQSEYRCNYTRHSSTVSCPSLDFLAIVDPTIRDNNSNLLCDELSEKYDVICRLYLKQIGLGCEEDKICPIGRVGRVPKIVYYVIFGEYKFRYVHYVSFTATARFLSPNAIYLIGDQHPKGPWWQRVMKTIPGVRFLYREMPKNISGQTPFGPIHLSDIVRLQVLYLNGGIYLDADMVVLKDLEPLLDDDLSLGIVDNASGMGNAFIVAKRGNLFLQEWYQNYTKYNNSHGKFYWNSLRVPFNMWKSNPGRVRLVSDQIYRPNWYEDHLLFNSTDYPWQDKLAVHVWSSASRRFVPESPSDIETANTTVAQIFRYVLYGDHRPRIGIR